MRKYLGLSVIAVALVAIYASFGALAMTGTVPGSPADLAAQGQAPDALVQPAKIKCGINEDGDFVCKNKKKEDGGSGGGNKCAGKNNCGSGYRDLSQPNKYGACCEQIPVTSCNQGCKNHCSNTFVPGSGKWASCVAQCGC